MQDTKMQTPSPWLAAILGSVRIKPDLPSPPADGEVNDNHHLHLKSVVTLLVWTLETGLTPHFLANELLESISFFEVTAIMYRQSAKSRVIYG